MSTGQSAIMSLADTVVLVTGVAGAIGAATAARLAQAGASTLLADLFPVDDERITKLQRALPEPAPYIACNISDEAQVRAMVERALELHGRLDGAANIAGIVGPSTLTADYPTEDFRQVIDVNVTGTWLCMKHELGAMVPRRSGAIVNVASIAGHSGEMYRAAYVASKAGVIGLTKTAAIEAAGLRCPGQRCIPRAGRHRPVPRKRRTAWIRAAPAGYRGDSPGEDGGTGRDRRHHLLAALTGRKLRHRPRGDRRRRDHRRRARRSSPRPASVTSAP